MGFVRTKLLAFFCSVSTLSRDGNGFVNVSPFATKTARLPRAIVTRTKEGTATPASVLESFASGSRQQVRKAQYGYSRPRPWYVENGPLC